MKKNKIKFNSIVRYFGYRLLLLGYILLLLVFQDCQWKHDGKILKDKDGNLYKLEASGIRNESYDLKPLPMDEIDSLLNTANGTWLVVRCGI